MPSRAWIWALMLVAPQSGWVLTHANPREVGRVYWELIPQTEVWVRLIPELPDGKPPLVNLVFHAFCPWRAERDPYTEVDPPVLRSIVTAHSVAGVALGFPFRLVADDRRAVGDFLSRVGLAEDRAPKK